MKKIISGEYRDEILKQIEEYLEKNVDEFCNDVSIIIEVIKD